ncbi:Centromere protein 3 [Smittium culicis]|uniref:Centromere protein 3 n=1 Tax=Smittium culicis TaxID=133412 RepID=A0A1R1XTS2_9FUNG|nr:Centromere protein 3 [Smittium culicis]OMJ18014.1 Centromere protein 3 [Smittium culicis]
MSANRPKRERRKSDFSELGIKGRKTGISIAEEVHTDSDGIEDIDDFYSKTNQPENIPSILSPHPVSDIARLVQQNISPLQTTNPISSFSPIQPPDNDPSNYPNYFIPSDFKPPPNTSSQESPTASKEATISNNKNLLKTLPNSQKKPSKSRKSRAERKSRLLTKEDLSGFPQSVLPTPKTPSQAYELPSPRPKISNHQNPLQTPKNNPKTNIKNSPSATTTATQPDSKNNSPNNPSPPLANSPKPNITPKDNSKNAPNSDNSPVNNIALSSPKIDTSEAFSTPGFFQKWKQSVDMGDSPLNNDSPINDHDLKDPDLYSPIQNCSSPSPSLLSPSKSIPSPSHSPLLSPTSTANPPSDNHSIAPESPIHHILSSNSTEVTTLEYISSIDKSDSSTTNNSNTFNANILTSAFSENETLSTNTTSISNLKYTNSSTLHTNFSSNHAPENTDTEFYNNDDFALDDNQDPTSPLNMPTLLSDTEDGFSSTNPDNSNDTINITSSTTKSPQNIAKSKPKPKKSINYSDNEPRKSTRTKLKPLEYWRNEHIVYKLEKTEDGNIVPSMQGVVKLENNDTKKPKRKKRSRITMPRKPPPSRSKKQKNNYSSDSDSYSYTNSQSNNLVYEEIQEKSVDHLLDAELDMRAFEAKADVVDSYTKSTVKRTVALSAPAVRSRLIPDNPDNPEFYTAGIFTDSNPNSKPFLQSGLIEIPPNSEKPPRNTKLYSIVFYVAHGSVQVTFRNSPVTLEVGSHFCVPRGNSYSIFNPGPATARIFFASSSPQE